MSLCLTVTVKESNCKTKSPASLAKLSVRTMAVNYEKCNFKLVVR